MSANTWYVTQTANNNGVGSGNNGLTLNSSWAVGGITWGGAGVNPGDTVLLNGNITSTLTIGTSGSSGLPITILFAPGAAMNASSGSPWGTTTSSAIYGLRQSYIIIDGGAVGSVITNPTGVNGVISCASNGFNLTTESNATGVYLQSGDHCTIQNLAFVNLYIQTANSGDIQNFGLGVNITYGGGAGTIYGNCTVNNCLFHDMDKAFSFGYYTSTNVTFSNCEVYNCCLGGEVGDYVNGATLTGMYVFGNNSHDYENWNCFSTMIDAVNSIATGGTGFVMGDIGSYLTPTSGGGTGGLITITAVSGGAVTGAKVRNGGSGYTAGTLTMSGGSGTGCTLVCGVNDVFHHDFFFTYGVQGGTTSTSLCKTIRYYNNNVGPNYGTTASAALFVQGMVDDVEMYNNILTTAPNSTDHPDDGLIYIDVGHINTGGTYKVYHNTFVGGGSAGQCGAINYATSNNYNAYPANNPSTGTTASLYIYNNLFINVQSPVAIYYYNLNGFTSTIFCDHNAYSGYSITNGFSFSVSPSGSATYYQYSNWQSTFGFDSNSTTAAPLVDTYYTPASNSPLRKVGITTTGVTLDITGHPRPAVPSLGAKEALVGIICAHGRGGAAVVTGP